MARKRTPTSKANVSGADMDRQDDDAITSDNAAPVPPTRAESEGQQEQQDDQPNAPLDAEARARAREFDRRDAELAMREYQEERDTIRQRTARLRAQRLARETSKPPKKPKL
ncbi:MAG: hypothetical protein JOZ94_20045 [Xanthobacteraceae bacterium]|nr:hypothetical protein [Xanthobacteraceae bacterium]